MNNKIICGFAGIGKSYQARTVSGVVDLESTPFKKDWEVYANVAIHMQKNGYTVLMSCHKEIRDMLKSKGADYVVVIPKKEDKTKYIGRYVARGNNQDFLEMFEKSFETFIDSITAEEENTVVLETEYLSL